jgi:hypothetical protein
MGRRPVPTTRGIPQAIRPGAVTAAPSTIRGKRSTNLSVPPRGETSVRRRVRGGRRGDPHRKRDGTRGDTDADPSQGRQHRARPSSALRAPSPRLRREKGAPAIALTLYSSASSADLPHVEACLQGGRGHRGCFESDRWRLESPLSHMKSCMQGAECQRWASGGDGMVFGKPSLSHRIPRARRSEPSMGIRKRWDGIRKAIDGFLKPISLTSTPARKALRAIDGFPGAIDGLQTPIGGPPDVIACGRRHGNRSVATSGKWSEG